MRKCFAHNPVSIAFLTNAHQPLLSRFGPGNALGVGGGLGVSVSIFAG